MKLLVSGQFGDITWFHISNNWWWDSWYQKACVSIRRSDRYHALSQLFQTPR